MAFGNNFKQSDDEPSVNNYCVGYAMAAILNDRHDCEQSHSKTVYDSLLEWQQTVVPPLQKLIHSGKCNQKDIILPSSLVLFACDRGFIVKLLYSKDLNFSQEIIQAEKQRCTEGRVQELDSKVAVLRCFSDGSVKYYLVLVNNHNHWIAVKRKKDNIRFSVYNPATGMCDKQEVMDVLMRHLIRVDSVVGDLIITLK